MCYILLAQWFVIDNNFVMCAQDTTYDSWFHSNWDMQAGNTPLHNAAYEGWIEGAELLLKLGAKINASNNAGDTAWHWADNMRNEDMCDFLVKNGASRRQGNVIVPEHIPKVKDFYSKVKNHPLPSQEFMAWRKAMDDAYEAEQAKLIPGM